MPISSGILAHCQKIGIAVWVFIWMIDRTTKEVPTDDGYADGMVYGGKANSSPGDRKRSRDEDSHCSCPYRTAISAGYLRSIYHGLECLRATPSCEVKNGSIRLLPDLGEELPLTLAGFCGPSQKNSRGFAESCTTLAKFCATLAEFCSL